MPLDNLLTRNLLMAIDVGNVVIYLFLYNGHIGFFLFLPLKIHLSDPLYTVFLVLIIPLN